MIVPSADKTTLKSAIGSVNFPGGEFNDLPSTAIIVNYIFNATTGDRLDAPNIQLLVTDGVPGIPTDLAIQASAMTQGAGIRVFVVCITTGCTEEWANALASQPIKVRYERNISLQLRSITEEDTYRFTLTPQSFSGYAFSALLC